MCHWMESYCHDWIDYNGVTFSIELLEWAHRFFDFLGSVRHSSSYILRLANIPESVYCRRKVKCSSINLKNGSIHSGSQKLHVCPKVTTTASSRPGWVDSTVKGTIIGQSFLLLALA